MNPESLIYVYIAMQYHYVVMWHVIGPDKQTFLEKNQYYFLIHQFKHLFWVFKIIEMVLLSTHNNFLGQEIIPLNFNDTLLSFRPGYVSVFYSFHHSDLPKCENTRDTC